VDPGQPSCILYYFHREEFTDSSANNFMEVKSEVVPTDKGDVLVHLISYPNGSAFIWITLTSDPRFDDFHAAATTAFSDVPSVTTRLGETDSIGRTLSLKLAHRLKAPCIVSWSLPVEFEDKSLQIEKAILAFAQNVKPHSDAVLGV
jgi:hypothetical protein